MGHRDPLQRGLLGLELDLIEQQVIDMERTVRVRQIFQIFLVGLKKMAIKHFLWVKFIIMQMITQVHGM